MNISDIRQFYAEEIRAVANIRTCWFHGKDFCLSSSPPPE